MTALFALLTASILAGTPAEAAGTATPPPPAPPAVDFSGLPDGAVFRPTNRDGAPHQVELRLVTDVDVARPGDTVRLGLWLAQDEGWHTYWKFNPEVGNPTDITWQLPDGATATPYAYPVPQRFDLEGIVSYGYDGQAFFFTSFTVPEAAPPGPVRLGAEAEWLTCEVNCIPGQGAVHTALTIAPTDAAPPEKNGFAPIFDHFAAQHPLPADAAAALVTITGALEPAAGLAPDQKWKAVFTIRPAEGRALAPHAPLGADPWPTLVHINDKDALWVESTTVAANDDGSWTVTLAGDAYEVPEPKPIDIGGLWQVRVDDTWVRTEVVVSAPWDAAATAAAPGDAPEAAAVLAEGASPYVDEATCQAMSAGLGSTAATPTEGGFGHVVLMLLAAFAGGLLLNIMPCVLPVITLKLYGLVEQRTDSTGQRVTEGLAYTAGILASFIALAAAVVVAQVGFGQSVGWGFQFQSPLYVAALGAIVFGFGLSLFGVFEIPALGANQAAQASYKEGPAGYFLTGIFATLLATPCSAPFLGSAMGFAFSQPPAIIVLFFAVAGLGLAAPFLLIAFVPGLYRLLPQPGPWMETFKQLMGFTLVATTLWLISVLSAQVSLDATLGYVFFLGFVGLAAWVFGHFGGLAASIGRQAGALVAALVVLVGGGWLFLDLTPEARELSDIEGDGTIPWQLLNEPRMASILARYREGQADAMYAGKPLFLDFTAEWCLTCKVNEKTILETDAMAELFRETGTVPLKGDWTNYDDNITSWLGCYRRAGVPFYVVLPADPTLPAIPLGEALTHGMVKTALEQATQRPG
jgi:thiol:disulfide interchange protein/DsbC/DsbD-like thiol-disulfide interchange protein